MSFNDRKFKPATLAMALSAAFPFAVQAAAGRIDFAVGDVKAVAGGQARALVKGDEINSGDTIETGGNGRAWLRFTDGAQVSLQPQSQYRIDNYKFVGQADGEERGFFSLLKGGLRTITGLIGRTNKKNYSVSTAVATIGIRGTEYSITYGNSITVTTGEGQVEVCNSAGCLTLNSGETAYVADDHTKPILASKKADLPPAPQLPPPEFSVGNDVTGSGGAAILGSTLLPSGSGYNLAWAGLVNAVSSAGTDSGAAVFGVANSLTAFTGSAFTYAPTVVTDTGSDGIIGWGRWVSGSIAIPFSVSDPMTDVSYVVGMPTSAADMTALHDAGYYTGTYSLIGGTAPMSSSGVPGTLTSGSLTADFVNRTVGGDISFSNNGNNYFVWWSGLTPIVGSSFTPGTVWVSTGGPSNSDAGAMVKGFFVGAGASRAGVAYKVTDVTPGPGPGYISGAAAFKQTLLSTTAP